MKKYPEMNSFFANRARDVYNISRALFLCKKLTRYKILRKGEKICLLIKKINFQLEN